MTDIADRLLNLRKAALQCSTSMLAGWSHGTDSQYKAAKQEAQRLCKALAEVPDPDAVQECEDCLREAEVTLRGYYNKRAATSALVVADRAKAALAKLEGKGV